jgi:hypothetical protein
LEKKANHIICKIDSSIDIAAKRNVIWENITNVKIEQFSDPILFRLLDIPKPLRAELVSEGKYGRRIAYFKNEKRFIQEILKWEPFTEYSFSFNPEKGFTVFYGFDISSGIFRILEGSYLLVGKDQKTMLTLSSTYSIDRRFFYLFNFPVRMILKVFQRYLLTSIKKNTE